MKLYFKDKTWCLSGNQNLSLYEGGSNFNVQPVFHFLHVHIMNVCHAKFQKKFDSGTISRELP